MKIELNEGASMALSISSVTAGVVLVVMLFASCAVKMEQGEDEVERIKFSEGHHAVIGYQPITGWVRTNTVKQ